MGSARKTEAKKTRRGPAAVVPAWVEETNGGGEERRKERAKAETARPGAAAAAAASLPCRCAAGRALLAAGTRG